jgi:LmbE family N-acetylglucosaminyl deacetylase
MVRRVVFFNPHADDVEVFCSSTCQSAIDAGLEVHQVLSNADEFGTPRIEFRGRRISRIRKWEMYKASKEYGLDKIGKPKMILHWLHNIDGFDAFNRDTMTTYRNLLLNLKPWAVFGPDPFFPLDFHQDHIATGRNYFFALKSIAQVDRPKYMFFYQSLKPDYCFPYKSAELEYRVRIAHRSQFTDLLLKILELSVHIMKRNSVSGWHMADLFRQVQFEPNTNQFNPHKWEIGLRLKYALWQHIIKFGWHSPSYFQAPKLEEILDDYNQNGWI